MLIFLTFRYTKAFEEWKQNRGNDVASAAPTRIMGGSVTEGTGRSKSGT